MRNMKISRDSDGLWRNNCVYITPAHRYNVIAVSTLESITKHTSKRSKIAACFGQALLLYSIRTPASDLIE